MKTVVTTAVGRKETLSILFKYVEKLYLLGLIDRWDWWLNCRSPKDMEYIQQTAHENKRWINLINCPVQDPKYPDVDCLRHFWQTAMDEDTIYVRFDDDIIFIELGQFEKFVSVRKNNKSNLLIYPLIINNTLCSYRLQQLGTIPPTQPMIGERLGEHGGEWARGGCDPCDPVAWQNPHFTFNLHSSFIDSLEDLNIEKWRANFTPWELSEYQTVSINSCAWHGSDIKSFNGQMPILSEEGSMVYHKPKDLGKFNLVDPTMIVAHYSFWPQKDFLDRTNILDKYRMIADRL